MAAPAGTERPARGSPRELPVALEIDGVPVHVEGHGEEALLMIHGWPDTARLWDAQVAAFGDAFRCVRFTLPGFDVARGARPLPLAGVTDLIGRIADAVSPQRPLALLLHDWGCAFGYEWALTCPGRVRRIVGVDVGDAGSPAHVRSLRLRDKAAIAAYQGWLIAAWRIGGARGDAMSRGFARLARAPGDPATIGHAMNQPYALLWSGAYADFQRRMRAGFEPPCPMLYVFGRRKPLQFHSPSWAARLDQRPGCRAVGLDSGHWPMVERAQEFNGVVREWLLKGNGVP
ncbi:alpha/beta fold hydrolase [Azohydromonas aeria]|uniref:alpha/beta fold hydrolase n=1 Tax=Azohydromonas aeria TaxID=2590212 RepID=UPI0012FA5ACC|nr:alpha/beta hydrolase [Azohydromonas aeria]